MEPKFVRLGRPDPIVCADSVLNVAFERRDPGAMQRFLEDFGFLPVEQRDQTTYFRGQGIAPYLVSVTESSRDARNAASRKRR